MKKSLNLAGEVKKEGISNSILLRFYAAPPVITWEHRRKIYPYIFLHFIGDGNRFIDFEKSLFYVQGAPTGVERVNIGSYDELLEQEAIAANSTPKTRVVAQPLVLQENNIDVDFFRIYGPQYAYYVSERIKLEVEKHDITGIVFIDPTA